jgi:hypothetical protein
MWRDVRLLKLDAHGHVYLSALPGGLASPLALLSEGTRARAPDWASAARPPHSPHMAATTHARGRGAARSQLSGLEQAANICPI